MGFKKGYEQLKDFFYKFRARYFRPILELLADLKITPNQITVFRFLFIVPIAYYFCLNNVIAAGIFYIIFGLLDLFDGALARYLNKQNDKGRFLDSFVDNFLYCFLILGFIYIKAASPSILAFNILLELAVQTLATIKNAPNFTSDWLIRVQPDVPYFKTIAYVVLFLYVIGINFLQPIFIILNLWLALTVVYYFFIIKKS